MDQYLVSGFERCLLKGVKCGYEDLRNTARVRPLEVRRNSGECIFVRSHKFGMSATTDDTHDTIAFMPALSIRTQFDNFAGKLQSRDVLRNAGRRRISTQS